MGEPTFATITADPDWLYGQFGAAKHGAARSHYPGSPAERIARIPVQRWGRPSSNLLLWVTLPKLDQGVDVMRAWGYQLVMSVPWVKTVPARAELAKGIGFWAYATSEVLMVCRRGSTKAPSYRKHEKPDGLLVGDKANPIFYARRGAHSRKPLSLIEWIESYLPGPHLELWATGERPGWTCWGHATGWHLDHDGVHNLAEMRLTDYERWIRTHPVMVAVTAMDPPDYKAWRKSPEGQRWALEDLRAARALRGRRR